MSVILRRLECACYKGCCIKTAAVIVSALIVPSMVLSDCMSPKIGIHLLIA